MISILVKLIQAFFSGRVIRFTSSSIHFYIINFLYSLLFCVQNVSLLSIVHLQDSKRLPEGNCTTRLTIRDGLLGHGQNRALLGSFCDSELPKLCEHKALQNETRLVRACTANESYISAGASLIIEQQFLEVSV